MPNVLRVFFKNVFHSKFKRPWIDSSDACQKLIADERWPVNLDQQQQKLLTNGDTHDWDEATFFHALLHSSHCLLADQVFLSNGCQLQCNIEHNSNFVVSKNAEFNFKSLLSSGDMIILDLGKESIESSVTNVQKEGFYIARSCTFTSISELEKAVTADLYLCRDEWSTIFALSEIKTHDMDHGYIKIIRSACYIMGAQQSIIDELEAIDGGRPGPISNVPINNYLANMIFDAGTVKSKSMKQDGTLQNGKQPVVIQG
jgi:hypothetical protein